MEKQIELAQEAIKAMAREKHNTLNRILNMALAEVGYTEGKNNANKFGEHFGIYNQPWCGSFVSWCYEHAGIDLPMTNKGIRGAHYVPLAYRYWKSKGYVTTKPVPGDIVIFEFNGDTTPDHIGIYAKNGFGPSFYAVEGNTSFDEAGSQSNGGAVAYKKRNIKSVRAFIHLPETDL